MFAISLDSISSLQSGELAEIISGNYLYKIDATVFWLLFIDEDAELAAYYDKEFEALEELAYQ